MASLVTMRGIVKRFGGTHAVDGVDFAIEPGQIHALLGGNGAGKSTLIKVLAGVHRADAGRIEVRGESVDPTTQRLPIAHVHQDLGLVPWMSVAENIALGTTYPRRAPFGLIDWRGVTARAEAALARLGCAIDPHARIADLSRADRSVVAIARALADAADVIVLDEPTASLPEAEVGLLFAVLARLRAEGVGIVYVSHRLDEVFRLADWVSVMRDGRIVADKPIGAVTPAELVALIAGREVEAVKHEAATPGPVVLSAHALVTDEAGPVSADFREREIVGLVGLRGAGQDSIGRALAGVDPVHAGRLVLRGRDVTHQHVAAAVLAGIAYVSAKRTEESIAPALSVRENLFANPAAEGRGELDWLTPRTEAGQALERLRAVAARPLATEPAINTFSGGNQQKVVLARWFGQTGRVLVLEEPTMGVDVGAKSDIHLLLARYAAAGGVVIVVSTDVEEVARLCHRALVFDRGRIVAELRDAALTEAALVEHVGGARQEIAAHA